MTVSFEPEWISRAMAEMSWEADGRLLAAISRYLTLRRDDGGEPRHTALMAASLFHDTPLKAKVIGWGIIFIPFAALVLLGAIFLRPEAIEQRLVWGCYVARDAPPLDIREDAIYIIEPARRTFSYIAEPSKTSYQLNVRPALLLKREPTGRYAFAPT